MEKNSFRSARISQTAAFIVNANIDEVFPLFGAFEERKWAQGWDPVLLYPAVEIIEEGTTFRTESHTADHGEQHYTWVVTRYHPENYHVQYLVMTQHRYWTITVTCAAYGRDKTTATVTYTFTGLTATGNKLNKPALEKMYRYQLQDWAGEINDYLKTSAK